MGLTVLVVLWSRSPWIDASWKFSDACSVLYPWCIAQCLVLGRHGACQVGFKPYQATTKFLTYGVLELEGTFESMEIAINFLSTCSFSHFLSTQNHSFVHLSSFFRTLRRGWNNPSQGVPFPVIVSEMGTCGSPIASAMWGEDFWRDSLSLSSRYFVWLWCLGLWQSSYYQHRD